MGIALVLAFSAVMAMVFKLVDSAQSRWFENGVLVERREAAA